MTKPDKERKISEAYRIVLADLKRKAKNMSGCLKCDIHDYGEVYRILFEAKP